MEPAIQLDSIVSAMIEDCRAVSFRSLVLS